MAPSFVNFSDQKRSSSVQDDDILWTEYLKEASNADARLVKDWTKVIDVLLVFVALFSSVLTAFIIQTSNNLQPDPAEVTNQLIIAIYNRTMNASAPINFQQFFELDDTRTKMNDFQNWLLYTSLTISMVVAALAMAAKLWIDPPRARAKRRQEVHDGLFAWRLEKCVDSMPVMALVAVILFALFVYSSIRVDVKSIKLAYFVGGVFLLGISFILIASFSAAFIIDSPYRSPFSDSVKFVFQILPNRAIPKYITSHCPVRSRTLGIVFVYVFVLIIGGYLILMQDYVYFPCVYLAIACIFALMREGEERDMRPRLVSLPQWVSVSFTTVFISFILSSYFSIYSTILCIFFFALASVLLSLQGFIGIKLSETRPKAAEAEAIAWLLKTSANKNPSWFQKAVQIAGESSNARALLAEKLLPLLVPLIISLPEDGQGDIKQERYINALATLMDFEPQERALLRNKSSLERPALPEELIARLEKLQVSGEKCSHKGDNSQEKWNVGSTARCPRGCVSDAVEHILRATDLE